MRCSKCGAESPDRAKFCVECASPFPRRCRSCNAENPQTAKFCLECGKPLEGARGKSQRVPDAGSPIQVNAATADLLDGERKVVTFLFADIKGSMELIEDLDPEEGRAIVDPALKLMMEAVQPYGGYVAQSTGDGIFALFGAPVAHEDHPQRALHAAMRMQEELRRYSDSLRAEGKAPVEIRIGINTGEVVMRSVGNDQTHAEYLPVGYAVGLASRLQTIAPTGSIALSEHTQRLVEGYFNLRSLGPTRIKGVTQAVNVYEVLGLGTLRTRLQRSASRGLVKFVGRQREMDALKRAAEQAKAGHGQIVAAMGEPGVGKSRLFHEFKAQVGSEWMVLEAYAVSQGQASAYLPVIEMLNSYFEITPEDDGRLRREKINERVLTLDRSLEDAIPHLLRLLGGSDDGAVARDATLTRRRTLDSIKRLLKTESLSHPLMLVFEDLHWVEEETAALLNSLADSIATSRILLMASYRPEHTHQWGSKTYYTQLRLDPIAGESADAMLASLLGDAEELAPLKRLIMGRTEGNPFFMEEIVQALLADGSLMRNGGTHLTRSLDALKIPATVQAILASRIDRLPAEEKELLQTLSVMGRQFSLLIVHDVTASSADELDSMLSHLQLAEFIYEQPAPGNVEYTFKHALTQDVAYNSVLGERRKLLHRQIGEAIEARAGERATDHAEELAHHFERSGDALKTVEYMLLAGERAFSRAAYREALSRSQQGLAALATTSEGDQRDRLELALQLLRGAAVDNKEGGISSEVREAYSRALELSSRAGAALEQRMTALFGLQHFYGMTIKPREARKFAEAFVESAKQSSDPSWLASSRLHLAQALCQMGHFPQARLLAEQALPAITEKKLGILGDERPYMRQLLGRVLWFLGFPDEGMRRAEEGFALIRAADLVPFDLMYPALTMVTMRAPQRAMRVIDRLSAFATEHELPFYISVGQALRGACLVQVGRDQEGLRLLDPIIEYGRSLGLPVISSWGFLIAGLEGYGRAGRTDFALELIRQALSEWESLGYAIIASELLRVKGELIFQAAQTRTDMKVAENSLRSAIALAQNQQARSLELRATTSFARMLAKQGHRDEASAMLAEIYNWFTEGFDTADLKDAKTLLDELSD